MNGKTRKLIALLTGLVMILTMMLAASSVAFADEDLPESITALYYPKQKSSLETSNWFPLTSDVSFDVDMDKSTIDNPSMLAFKEEDGYLYVILKKAGKTTIHLVATPVGSSEAKTYDINVKVEKYVNPLKTFKIGKKNYAKKFKKDDFWMVDKKKVSGKLKLKAAKGWKIVSIQKQIDSDLMTVTKIKNNKKVTLKRGQSIYVNCKNKKSGQKLRIVFHNMMVEG